jgi:uncharacterized protein YbjQ (UPF0145 family)
MLNPKDILVVTTSTVDGLKINKYLKPISAHVVAGTNLFSDFMGGITDIFGGRSQSYQRQLSSLYNDAIEQVKYAACEIGANCIVGLQIDMDEISGKGKSMFMLTAIGTAVIIEKELVGIIESSHANEKMGIVSLEKLNLLKRKNDIINKTISNSLNLNDEIWEFITTNQVVEVFSYLLKKFPEAQVSTHEASEKFYKSLVKYLDNLPERKKLSLLYKEIGEQNESITLNLLSIIKDLNLFDFELGMGLLKSNDFQIKKRGVSVVSYDKPFYIKEDIKDLKTIRDFLESNFGERGTKTFKKQLLSSKEKEVWMCQCGKTNEINSHCVGCGEDIYGFKNNEVNPIEAISKISNKIKLISEYMEN